MALSSDHAARLQDVNARTAWSLAPKKRFDAFLAALADPAVSLPDLFTGGVAGAALPESLPQTQAARLSRELCDRAQALSIPSLTALLNDLQAAETVVDPRLSAPLLDVLEARTLPRAPSRLESFLARIQAVAGAAREAAANFFPRATGRPGLLGDETVGPHQ
ncbi:MAG: hypothetical protein IPK79_04405 [Vampirovibrionales bacterium]|nr:hypothetical protein [Vampirovibrionales bacterium]